MQKNVAGLERLASVLIGGLSLSQTLKSERGGAVRAAAAAVGLGFIYRGVTGHCPIYQGLDVQTYKGSQASQGPLPLERSALVNLPIEEVRSFLEMEDTPYGLFDRGNLDDEFQIEIEGRSWILTLSPHADGNRTLIKTTWIDHPSLGHGEGKGPTAKLNLLDQKPKKILELRKLKALMETGEIASIEGQPHGLRSRFGNLVENFGDLLLQTIQSKTALPREDALHFPLDQSLLPPLAQRKAHA